MKELLTGKVGGRTEEGSKTGWTGINQSMRFLLSRLKRPEED